MAFVQRIGLLLVVATFLTMIMPRTSTALPPDFFRPVRQQESPAKMAAAVPQMLKAICDYCAKVYGPVYGLGCLQDDGNTRRQCLARLLRDIQFK